jgi:hypothetical protein
MATTPLPRDEHGSINTSANFGTYWAVEIVWNTTPDGAPVEDWDDSNRSLYGAFESQEEALCWMDSYPEDTDVRDMEAVVMNRVRPGA